MSFGISKSWLFNCCHAVTASDSDPQISKRIVLVRHHSNKWACIPALMLLMRLCVELDVRTLRFSNCLCCMHVAVPLHNKNSIFSFQCLELCLCHLCCCSLQHSVLAHNVHTNLGVGCEYDRAASFATSPSSISLSSPSTCSSFLPLHLLQAVPNRRLNPLSLSIQDHTKKSRVVVRASLVLPPACHGFGIVSFTVAWEVPAWATTRILHVPL